MSEDAENHTILLLQEMRREISGLRADMRDGFATVTNRLDGIDSRLDETNTRIDGVAHLMPLLDAHSSSLDDRVSVLESARPS